MIQTEMSSAIRGYFEIQSDGVLSELLISDYAFNHSRARYILTVVG